MKNNKFIYLTLFSLLFVFLVNSLPSIVVLADVINGGEDELTIMVCKEGDCTSETVDCTIEYDDDCKAVCDGEFESCADTCKETAWSCEEAISDCQDNCYFTGDAQENCLRECGDYGSCEAAYRVCFGECSSASATCVMNCVSVDCPVDECVDSTDCDSEKSTYIVSENGQNETSISTTSLRHTSLSKCKVDTYSLPHTFTQTDSSHTYTVSCTGDAGYNNCSDDIAITKGSTAFSVQLTANGQTDNIYVKPNTDVKLVATPSNGKPPYTRYQWTIKDKSVWHDTCSLTNPSDFGHYETCFKRHGGMMQLFNNIFSVMTKFIEPVLAAFPNDNTIYYQWSQTDTYKIYVIVTDSANKTATSNTITITVSNISTHLECNSAGQCVSVPGAGVNLCNTDADCPPPPPPPTCTISEFTINEKCNTGGNCSQQQTPLIVWVNASLTGYFSVNDSCKTCTVSSDDTWGSPPQSYPISTLKSSYPESFKITTAGTYSYTLECVGADPEDIVTDTLSLQTVKAMNLPWWREIIPNLLPFLRGMIR